MGAKRKALRVTVVVDPVMFEDYGDQLEGLLNDLLDRSPAAAAMSMEAVLKGSTVLRAESCDLIDRPDDIY